LSDLQNCKKFLLKNSGIIAAQVENSKNGDEVMTPTTQSKSLMLRKIQQDEGRQVLTKNQIAQRELKNEAIKSIKEKMGQFELQLLKADEETKEVIKNRNI
jgi:hypothetical protein